MPQGFFPGERYYSVFEFVAYVPDMVSRLAALPDLYCFAFFTELNIWPGLAFFYPFGMCLKN